MTVQTPQDRSLTTGVLPARIRARVLGLAADALDTMPVTMLPGALRKGASFSPSKRRRLIAGQLAVSIDNDPDFVAHLAAHVRALVPDLAARLESTDPADAGQHSFGEDDSSRDGCRVVDPDGDPAVESAADVDRPEPSGDDVAAVSFLLRQPGWRQLVTSAVDAHRASGDLDVPDGDLRKLRSSLDAMRSELRDVREKHKGQLDALKSEISQLRRNLGQARVELRDAQAREADESALARDLRASAEVSARAHDAEVRRLRRRIAELETQNSSARRAGRDDRDAEVARLRLLLDTMGEALAGMRRELALPFSDLLPADTVPAVEPQADSRVMSTGRSLDPGDPATLRALIELPKLHLIVDGYNVSKAAWESSPLDAQRDRLVSGLSALVAGKGIETTVVFDGAELRHPPVLPLRRLVRVLFSPPGVIADDVIFQLVEAEPVGRPVVVVSSDRELTRRTSKKGARAVDSTALTRILSA